MFTSNLHCNKNLNKLVWKHGSFLIPYTKSTAAQDIEVFGNKKLTLDEEKLCKLENPC